MIFRCAKCLVPVTRDLFLATESLLTKYEEGMYEEDYVPRGFYSVGVPFRVEPEIYPRLDEHYVVNLKDLINTKQNDRDGGCCGLSGMSGMNTVCVHDHELGVECSDCWHTFHFIHFPPDNVAPVEK